jgi:hypothetical protein
LASPPAGAGILRALLAAHHGAFGLVLFIGLLARSGVEIHRHLRAHAAVAHHRRDQLLDALDIGVFDAMRGLELLGRHGRIARLRRRQQPSLLIHHGDLVGIELRDARGHQMHDCGHLLGFQAMAGTQLQQHRGAGRTAIAHERRLLRDGQVHARSLDRLQ